MTEKLYRINEIFYSLQGEGRWAGKAAIFIRFSGCNLKCPFCDTDFSGYVTMTVQEIIDTISQYKPCNFVVLTGGEPTLQVDATFVTRLHMEGFYVSMETNGTRPVPSNVDWITVSPKQAYVENGETAITKANEVKVVYDGKNEPMTYGIQAEEYYVQPCDTGFLKPNSDIIERCVDYVKRNPHWRLSLQQQKILKVR